MEKFLDVYKLGMFEIRGEKIPRVLLGTSPFMGAGQFGPKASSYYSKFFLNPKNIKKIILECIGLGMNAVQPFGYRELIDPIVDAMKESKSEIFVLGSIGLRNIEEEMELFLKVKPKCMAIHAVLSDRDLRSAIKKLHEMKNHGMVTGIVTHKPGTTIPKVENFKEVDFILAPVNKIGMFMDPNFEFSMQTIEKSSKPIIAIKPLAAGKLRPEEAFEFLSGRVEGMVVGITSREEAEETFAAAEKYFKHKE